MVLHRLAVLLGAVAFVALAALTVLITRGDWGDFVRAAWLEPDAELVSLEYALFAITSGLFMVGGVLAWSRPAASLAWTGSGFLFALVCFDAFGSVGWDGEGLVGALLFFVLPAAWFLRGSFQVRRALHP